MPQSELDGFGLEVWLGSVFGFVLEDAVFVIEFAVSVGSGDDIGFPSWMRLPDYLGKGFGLQFARLCLGVA